MMKSKVLADKVSPLAASGLCQSEIARELGVTKQRISQIVKQEGIACVDKRGGHPLFEERFSRFLTEGLANVPRREAAERLGILALDTITHYRVRAEQAATA